MRVSFISLCSLLVQNRQNSVIQRNCDFEHIWVFFATSWFLCSLWSNTHSGTCALKHSRVTVTVSLGERLHHAVDLLSFAGQPEAPEELPERLDQVQVRELVQVQEGVQNLDVEVISARCQEKMESPPHTHTHTHTHTKNIKKTTHPHAHGGGRRE